MANADALRQQIVEGSNNIMRATAEDAMSRLLARVPFRTGALAQSGYMQQASDGPRISWLIGFTAPQGEWIEEGTEPHAIYPSRPGGVLHWYNEMTGEDVFARYVLDNSITPRPWFHPTLEESWPELVSANADAAGWS